MKKLAFPKTAAKVVPMWIAACAAAIAWPAPAQQAATAPASQAADVQPSIKIINAPEGSFVPDVMMGAKGALHMVYARDRNAYYQQSSDNGVTFTRPVKVNSEGDVCFTMGERGPKLALGKDGSIHVVWADIWAPGVKVFARYSRSLDGGKTFEPMKTVSSMSGIDGLTLAADDAGNVLVFWHTMSPVQKEVAQATWLHVASSKDNGATFAHDQHVKIDGLSELACSMCVMRGRNAGKGRVYLAYRGAVSSIRDFYVLKGSPGDNMFTPVRVNRDNWDIKTCPMNGPELTVAPDGRLVCAFMTRNKVYWTISDPKVTDFKLHVPTPANEMDEIYPSAVANKGRYVLLVWQVGPMSTTGKATVKYALYTIDGKFVGKQGTIGQTTSGTKATAFVGTDDNFYVVTTARPAR